MKDKTGNKIVTLNCMVCGIEYEGEERIKKIVMKEIRFRPLRFNKKLGKIIVASYTQWNAVRCANYSKFKLNIISDYKLMPKDAYVYDHKGELLYHFNYNPWDVFVYYGSCIDGVFDWDYMRAKYKSFSIESGFMYDSGEKYISYHWQGADCEGTPTFSHLTADKIANAGYRDLSEFEPLTVGYVLDWLSWFFYQLENSHLKVITK